MQRIRKSEADAGADESNAKNWALQRVQRVRSTMFGGAGDSWRGLRFRSGLARPWPQLPESPSSPYCPASLLSSLTSIAPQRATASQRPHHPVLRPHSCASSPAPDSCCCPLSQPALTRHNCSPPPCNTRPGCFRPPNHDRENFRPVEQSFPRVFLALSQPGPLLPLFTYPLFFG